MSAEHTLQSLGYVVQYKASPALVKKLGGTKFFPVVLTATARPQGGGKKLASVTVPVEHVDADSADAAREEACYALLDSLGHCR